MEMSQNIETKHDKLFPKSQNVCLAQKILETYKYIDTKGVKYSESITPMKLGI